MKVLYQRVSGRPGIENYVLTIVQIIAIGEKPAWILF